MSDCRIIARPIGSWGDNSLETRETDLDFKYEPEIVEETEPEAVPVKVMK